MPEIPYKDLNRYLKSLKDKLIKELPDYIGEVIITFEKV